MGEPMPSARARALRKSPTMAEQHLWRELRQLKRQGFHFRRQVPFGRYIVDFACHNARLIIEVDGGQHGLSSNVRKDAARTFWLEQQGYRVLRLWNNDVLGNMDSVFSVIMGELGQAKSPPTPGPSPQGGGEY